MSDSTPSTILDADEETDTGGYRAYLRAQSDADLMDIAQHLDPERYPARCDTARREIGRRGLWQTPVYDAAEMAVRRLAVFAFAPAAVVLALTHTLTFRDAAGPPWPTDDMMPDGIRLGEIIRLFGVALGRGIVTAGAHGGVFFLLLAGLGGWVVVKARAIVRRRARADVWRLALLGLVALLLALIVAAGPGSAVPSLFGVPDGAPLWDRALPLWDPFATGQA